MGAKVLVLGLAFKENCPDVRNTKVVDIVTELKTYGVECRRARSLGGRRGAREYGIDLVAEPE